MHQPPSDMIRVIAGEVGGHPLENEFAALEKDYLDEYPEVYVVITGEQTGEPILPDTPGDGIWEWEEVTVIPTDSVNALRRAVDRGNTSEILCLAAYIATIASTVHTES